MPTENTNTSGATSGTGTSGGQTLNQVFNTNVQQQLDQVGASYLNYYWDRQAWFQNPANGLAIAMAVDEIGMPPEVIDPYGWRKNYQSWCHAFGPMVQIYELALLFDKYRIPQSGSSDFCRVLKALLFSMDDEQIASDRLFVIQNDHCNFNAKTIAINAFKSKVQNLFNLNTCDVVIQNQNAAIQMSQNQQIQDHSTELQLKQQQEQAKIAAAAAADAAKLQKQLNASNASNVANVAGTGLKGTNSFMVYAIIGGVVILMVGAVMVFREKTN